MSLKRPSDQEAVWLKGLAGRYPTLVNVFLCHTLSADISALLTMIIIRIQIRSSLLVLVVGGISVEAVPLKRSLAERLGRVVDGEEPVMPLQKGEYEDTCSLLLHADD